MWLRITTSCCALILFSVVTLWAADKHKGHTPGMTHGSGEMSEVQLREGGQAAYAAIIEVVASLENDDDTDWNAVDIDALREHLLDMDRLMVDSQATTSVIGDTQVVYEIQGSAMSVQSIHRMVPAHSRFIQISRGWSIAIDLTDSGAIVTVDPENRKDATKLKALGFYGYMSLDSHHQSHHWQMAQGMQH